MQLPLADVQDFEDARRGLLGSLPDALEQLTASGRLQVDGDGAALSQLFGLLDAPDLGFGDRHPMTRGRCR